MANHLEVTDLMAENASLKARIQVLETHIRSISNQCGNVIYNCEQRPADNERHLSSWKGVKEYADAALNPQDKANG